MKLKTVASIITISIITTIMTTILTQGNIQNSIIEEDTFTLCFIDETEHYDEMSTKIIQLEVEKHSKTGDLPFDLGVELIQRWTKD